MEHSLVAPNGRAVAVRIGGMVVGFGVALLAIAAALRPEMAMSMLHGMMRMLG